MLVFGYGSLVNGLSRARTLGNIPAQPAIGLGIARGWWVRSETRNMTALGVVLRKQARCNGVLFEVDDGQLTALEGRESSYDRVWIRALDQRGVEVRCATYVPRTRQDADLAFPIVQSYLDVALSGFLSLGVEQAEQFVRTTDGWQAPRLDDRTKPRYHSGEVLHTRERLDAVLSGRLPAQ